VEAEYYSLSECAKHFLWYKNFLNGLNIDINSITIFADNKTIYISENQSINPKSKHIDIRYHHIRDLVFIEPVSTNVDTILINNIEITVKKFIIIDNLIHINK